MTTPQLILALDAGAFLMRCTLFDLSGAAVDTCARRLNPTTPTSGWHEQDAAEVWAALLDALAELARRHDLSQIAAVGLANQRGTCLLWDRATGEPLGPAIGWSDKRTDPFIAALREAGHDLLVQVSTGVPLHHTHSAPKLRWMLDNLPGAGGLLAVGQLAGGTLDSWLLWNLSAGRVHGTDYSNAQQTLLLNLAALEWDRELARLFSVPAEILPVVASGPRVWDTTDIPGMPQLLAPIGAIAADQTAALFGHGALVPGDAMCSYGTNLAPLAFCGPEPVGAAAGMSVVTYDITGSPAYGIGATIPGGALALEWCCTKLGAFTSVDELVMLAAQAPPNEDVVFVPAFAGSLLPTHGRAARAAILGLDASSDRGAIARAALESIALQVADMLAFMRDSGGVPVTRLLVDGGLARSDVLMQMQADLAGIPVERPTQSELAPLGIAYLAAHRAGLAVDQEFLERGRGPTRVFTPLLDEAIRQRRLSSWHTAIQSVASWSQG